MNEMDPKNCSESITVCESSSGSVPEAVILVSDSVSNHVLIKDPKENDSRTGKDGVGTSNVSPHAVYVADKVAHERDASTKAKAKEFHVIDLSGGVESERICRICHFGSDQTPDRVSGKAISVDLIEIGCKCKNELGLAHFHCAEAWFKLKGNSVCEICGSSALNVPVRLTEEEWSELRDTTMDEGRRRGSGRSCCIFMVFLLTIILLHWFFKKMSTYYQNTSY